MRKLQKRKITSIAVLTSGGDAPGMNAAIRAVVRFGISKGCHVSGVRKGFLGLLEDPAPNTPNFLPLTASSVANIIQKGGTILKTNRCLDFYKTACRKRAAQFLLQRGVEALVVIGGDGSFMGAHLLETETGFPTIGVPATIDNDIFGTDDSIGFDTAVNTAIGAIDRIRDTASSHDRTFVVEVMGRSSGHIALQVGMGGGAETILVPEKRQTLDGICKTIRRGIARGKTGSIIVVAEGSKPGLATRLGKQLDLKGYSSRVCILGHIQRGGSPTAHDRYLASVLGASAVERILENRSNSMVGLQDNRLVCLPFKGLLNKKKPLSYLDFELTKILAI